MRAETASFFEGQLRNCTRECKGNLVIGSSYNTNQAANLAGFRVSEDPRFEAGIPDFMNGRICQYILMWYIEK